MNSICNINKLAIGLDNVEGSLNWTHHANGRLEIGGPQGRFLVLLLNYLNVPPLFYNLAYLRRFKQKVKIDMLVGKYYPGQYRGFVATTATEMNFVTFAVKKYVPLSTRFAFLYPFTLNTWLGFLFVAIITPALGIVLMRQRLSYLDLFLQMFGCFFKQCFQVSAKSLKLRIFLLFWLFFTMVISFSYSAVFFSFMVNPLKIPPIKNFEELSAAVTKGTHKCYFFNSNYVKYAVQNSSQSDIRRLAKIFQVKSHSFGDYGFDIYESAIDQGNVILRDKYALNLKYGINSEVFISDDNLFETLTTPHLIRKNSCLREKIDLFISHAWSSGLYQKILKDEQIKQNRPTATDTDLVKPLSLHDISGILIFFVCGTITSFFVFVMEIVIYYFRKMCLILYG